MGVRSLFRRLERRIGRFNRWLAPAAISANAASGDPAQPVADPAHVVAALGALEQGGDRREPRD
jgi:hypothetical protein